MYGIYIFFNATHVTGAVENHPTMQLASYTNHVMDKLLVINYYLKYRKMKQCELENLVVSGKIYHWDNNKTLCSNLYYIPTTKKTQWILNLRNVFTL